ncbi:hypothetical protein VNI00_012748 [Paramarasmius palmivorus]|uniref:DUF7330 domain-containing protein n=1 Tax=Paramarasmius palmivorus TaxID=297713 RepID=A0AAW0C415_9AGAR
MTATAETDSPPHYKAEEPNRAVPTKASSYIRIVREGGVSDSFVIDPSIKIKESLLPKLDNWEKNAGRRNLWVKTTGNHAEIDVDVEVKNVTMLSGSQKKVIIGLEAQKADVLLRLHAPSQLPRPRLYVYITSGKGNVVVSVPRSTTGLFGITSAGPVNLSDQLSKETITLNEDGRLKQLIVGPVSDWDEGDKDQITVLAHGTVDLRYDDESDEQPE